MSKEIVSSLPRHRAMVKRINVRSRAYWASVGPWRDNADAAKKDADAHRLEIDPVARIRIFSLTSEAYNG